jgi:hypothetical protein
MSRLKILLLFCLFLINIISCTDNHESDNGLLLKGKVEFNGYEGDNLYIKVFKDTLSRWENVTLEMLDPLNIVDSIKVEKDGTYQKYLNEIPFEGRYLLLIRNDEITSDVGIVSYQDMPGYTQDFYLHKFGYINLTIKREIQSERNVHVLIYAGSYIRYNYYFYESLIDTTVVHKIMKGTSQVLYDVSQRIDYEFEEYSFSKCFYDDFSDTIYYTINITY